MNASEQRHTAIIELVDSEILALAESGELLRNPGFALLNDSGVETGESAFHQSWLYPQRSYNQFWHQLTLAPLPSGNRFARHHADLAYAQLSQLHRQLGSPGELLFAIPGSFSRDQLAILLGLANALPVKTLGLVDAAVAAATALDDYRGELLHLDIQLHQAVVTRLRADNEVTREGVEVLPDTGLRHFYRGWAQHIANLFIREYRYDPLHNAEGEQQLFNQLPGILAKLAEKPETVLALATPRGEFSLNLQRAALLESSLSRISRLRSLLSRLDVDGPLLASYRLGKLPGIASELGARLLGERHGIDACLRLAASLDGASDDGVDFITCLPRFDAGDSAVPARRHAARQLPTHLLYGHRAWPLGKGLGIDLAHDSVRVSRDPQAPLRLQADNDRVWLVNTRYDLVVDGNRDDLRGGDLIRVEGHELRLIEVASED